VLVSLHGGGFATGSGNHAGFDGAALARFGDAVVVTINHRLGVLGYLHLADFPGVPDEWATSGTVGMQDCVAALRWIKENIANFGGDPDRVMVFGQSGGGAKTCALLAMPSAVGLLHRGGIQSGSAVALAPRENANRNAKRLLDRLGLAPKRVAELRDVPVQVMIAAQAAMEAGATPAMFAPVVDGNVLPQHPFTPAGPEISRDIPLIVSTTLDEATGFAVDIDLDEDGLRAQITEAVGEASAQRVHQAYRAAYPDIAPFLVMARVRTDRGQFRSSNTLSERKAAQGGGAVYKYLFTWPSPAYEGRFAAVHGVDVSLVFHRYESIMHGGGVPRAKALAYRRPERSRGDRVAGVHARDAGHPRPRRNQRDRRRPAARPAPALGRPRQLSPTGPRPRRRAERPGSRPRPGWAPPASPGSPTRGGRRSWPK
jgi:para-nitrobenzyl esterase